MTSVNELVDIMLLKLISTLKIISGSEVCIIVNNLGSVSQLEIGIICNKVYTSISKFILLKTFQ